MRSPRALPLLLGGLAALLLHAWVADRLGARSARDAAALSPPRPALVQLVPAAVAAPGLQLASADPHWIALPALDPATASPAPARPGRTEAAPAVARHARLDPSAAAAPTAGDSAPAEPPPAEAPDAQAAEPAAPLQLAAADDAGAAPGAAAPPDEPLPTYRTRIPAAARVAYQLSRGMITGSGEIDWQPQGRAYALKLEGSVPLLGTLLTQTSQGRLDAAGLAPERHTDKRLRRAEQAASFDRREGRIRFSGQSPELPLQAGVQDRLSVMLQLAAIANAWSKPPAPGERYRIQVVGARGDSHLWSLRFEGPQAVETPQGSVRAWRFQREPETPQDTRAEFWLDPARQCLPVRARLTDGSGDAFELLRLR